MNSYDPMPTRTPVNPAISTSILQCPAISLIHDSSSYLIKSSYMVAAHRDSPGTESDVMPTLSLPYHTDSSGRQPSACIPHMDTPSLIPSLASITAERLLSVSSLPALPDDLAVAFWNINGAWRMEHKLEFISQFITHNQLDFLALIDSRDSVKVSQIANSIVKASCPGYSALVTPIQSDSYNLLVGGITVILSARLSRPRPHVWTDKSGLGIISGYKFQTPSGPLLILAVYLPTQSDVNTNGLFNQLTNWLLSVNRSQTARQYIRDTLQAKIRKHMLIKGARLVLGGDFNLLEAEIQDLLGNLRQLAYPFSHAVTNQSTRAAETGRRIDHILVTPGQLVSHTLHAAPVIHLISDHYPLSCRLRNTIAPIRVLPPSTRPLDIDLKDVELIQRYQAELEKYIAGSNASLGDLCSTSAGFFARKGSLKKWGKRHLWSPRMMALLWWYCLLKQIDHSPGDPSDRYSLVQQCQRKVTNIGSDGPNLWQYLQELGITAHELTQETLNLEYLKVAITRTASMSHGKARQRERNKINEARIQREAAFKEGKLRKIIRSLLPTSQPFLDLNALQLRDNSWLCDPEEIHNQLLDKFQTWFARSDHPSASLPRDSWVQWTQNPALLQSYLLNQGIPMTVCQVLMKGILHPGLTKLAGVVLDMAAVEPTHAEFLIAIRNAPKGKAPGPSGLTYNMIKGWSDTVSRWAYDCLLRLWRSDSTELWWNSKLLYPIPKTENPTLDTLRPIMLLESLRKLWMKIIIQKVMHSWELHKVLCPAQYGFRKGRQTGHAILQVINAMEEAEEEATVIYMSSWDITRAFDSITRPVIMISLQRLGLHRQLAEKIAFMDNGDQIFPATPWYRYSTHTAPSFSSHKGTGQGDVSSPALWTAFFDMLLRALESVPSDFHVRGLDGNISRIGDTAFADDLLSATATRGNLQRKADVVSGFALAFGLDLALHKFRTQAVTWGREHLIEGTGIDIHSSNWVSNHIRYTEDDNIKYLGSRQNWSNNGETDSATISALMKNTAAILAPKATSPEMVVMVDSLVPQAQANYMGQFGAWSFAHYQSWDTPLLGVHKSNLHAQRSHPTALLCGPKSHGGLGIQSVSTRLQKSKYSLLNSMLLSSDLQTRRAAYGLLERGARASNTSLMDYGSYINSSGFPSRVNYWIRSLAEFMAFTGTTLRLLPKWETNLLDQPISVLGPISLSMKTRLVQLGISRVGDMIYDSDGTGTFRLFTLPNHLLVSGESFPQTPTLPSLTHQRLYFRPGQVWLSTGSGIYADEILGWRGYNIILRRWELSHSPTSRQLGANIFLTTPIICRLITPTRGAGSNLIISFHEAESIFKIKCILDSDKFSKSGLIRNLWGWHHLTPHTMTRLTAFPTIPWIPQLLGGDLMASDASWGNQGNVLTTGLVPQQGIGIIISSRHSMQSPSFSLYIDCLHLLNPSRAFTLETMALILACLLTEMGAPRRIVSDCQGAISLCKAPTSQKGSFLELRRTLAGNIRVPVINWTKGHPDRTLGLTSLTHDNWANIQADQAAEGRQVGSSHTVASAQQLLTSLAEWQRDWFVAKGPELDILTPTERYHHTLIDSYLSDRSQRYPTAGPWTRAALTFAIRARGGKSLSMRQRVAVQNLFLGRFDRDRLASAGTLHPCVCGTGFSNLTCWISCCTCPTMLAIRDTARVDIERLLDKDQRLLTTVSNLLFQDPSLRIWRGNWSGHDLSRLTITSESTKVMLHVTSVIIGAALDMYSAATHRERLDAASPRAVGVSHRRRLAPQGNRKLTEFNFTIGQLGVCALNTS